MKARWLFFGLCAGLFACGPTVDGVCETLENDCGVSDTATCESDGEAVESKADNANCSDQFDTYLECVNDKTCDWHTACAPEIKALEACGVSLEPQ